MNLTTPPGFKGLDEFAPCEVYIRNLPHWRQTGATYFVTFHFADALPEGRQRELVAMRRDWERRNPPPHSKESWEEFAKATFQQVETWMDAGHGACWLSRPEYAESLEHAILHFHNVRYEIGCFVNMGNHCHLVMRPFEDFDLENLIGGIKRYVAMQINSTQGRVGALWREESYDRIIRDAEHLYRVVQYIGSNPFRAGLPKEQWRRWMNPEWEVLGWGFRDRG